MVSVTTQQKNNQLKNKNGSTNISGCIVQ